MSRAVRFAVLGALLTAPAHAQTLVDARDGRLYEVVAVGELLWFAENLAFDVGEGGRCYDDEPSHCVRQGRLYSWQAATRACPAPWRLPSEDDWRRLEAHLGMTDSERAGTECRGTDQGARIRAGGDTELNVQLFGYMRPDGTPRRLGERAAFWTATQDRVGETAWHRDVSEDPRIYRSPVDFGYFLSVRCVREPAGS